MVFNESLCNFILDNGNLWREVFQFVPTAMCSCLPFQLRKTYTLSRNSTDNLKGAMWFNISVTQRRELNAFRYTETISHLLSLSELRAVVVKSREVMATATHWSGWQKLGWVVCIQIKSFAITDQ